MAQVYLTQKQPNYEDLRIDTVCLVLDRESKPFSTKHYQSPIF